MCQIMEAKVLSRRGYVWSQGTLGQAEESPIY